MGLRITNPGTIGTLARFGASSLAIAALGAGAQASLAAEAGPATQYWDGANTTPGGVANGRGGTATWDTTTTNWTDQAGAANAPWAGGIAVFGPCPNDQCVTQSGSGTVTSAFYKVTIAPAGITAGGLRTQETSPTINGGPLALTGGARIDVIQAGATTRTLNIDSNITAAGDLIKGGLGSLFLSANTQVAGGLSVAGVMMSSGATATLAVGGSITVGGTGTDAFPNRLLASGGARMTSAGGSIGGAAGTAGSVFIQRGGTWDAGANVIDVGASGVGVLRVYSSLVDAVSEIKASEIVLGRNAGGNGKLQIWGDDSDGIVTATRVFGGVGGGSVEFDNYSSTAAYVFAPLLSGNLSTTFLHGSTTLRGVNDYTGTTLINGGTVILDGASLTRTNVTVQRGVLAGNGTIGGTIGGGGAGGAVTFAATNTTLRGQSGQLLTMGSLALGDQTVLDVTLGAPSTTALFNVTGNLTLDGKLSVTNGGGFATGSYRLFDYGGALTDNGLVITSLPAGFNPGDWSIAADAGKVDLLVPTTGAGEQYWDGANMTPGSVANGRGGNGTWNAANTNWTNQAGTINAPWAGGTAVFGQCPANACPIGPGATTPSYKVTVDPAGVGATGIRTQDVTVTLNGGSVALTGAAAAIDVVQANASQPHSLTANNEITAAGDLAKTGLGSLFVNAKVQVAGNLSVEGVMMSAGAVAPLIVGGTVSVGGAGTNTFPNRLLVTGGSKLTSTGGSAGGAAGTAGAIYIQRGGIWDAGDNTIEVGASGVGLLNVYSSSPTNVSEIKASQIVLGRNAGGSGKLQIWGDATSGVSDGIITAQSIVGGIGGGSGEFDNPGSGVSSPSQVFPPPLSGKLGTTFLTGGTTPQGGEGHTGGTPVHGGTLVADGAAPAPPAGTVRTGALGGSGSIAGAVTVSANGILEGRSGRKLTMGSLALDGASRIEVALGAPSPTALFDVLGNLTLAGTLNVTDAGGFGTGVYRLFDYGGTLAGAGLGIGTLPADASGEVQTSVAHQVNLVVNGTPGPGPVPTIQFWNGMTTVADGTIHGGSGTWTAGPTTNWTDANGATASAWSGNFAVFQGGRTTTNGTVQVDAGQGAISTTGMQFIGTGWSVTGSPIALNGADGATTIRVGDGSAAGANDYAIIRSALTGATRLVKDDLGKLILTGQNTYSGGTTIAAGTLQIGNGATQGSILGDVVDNGTLAFANTDSTTTFGGRITGSGAVRLIGGSVVYTADNAYAGVTTIQNGASLSLGSGGTTGAITGDLADDGELVFNRSNGLTYGGRIGGAGALRQIGAGKTELTGDSSAFTGTTTIENGVLAVNGKLGGVLTIRSGGRLQGSGTVGNVTVGGTLAPGNSIGTLNVGSITFSAGSIYEVEVNALGQSDRIQASGTATINGGAVQVLAGTGDYAAATTYTILTANGGRTGTFTGGVTSNLAFLDPSLSYDANNVYLTMTRNDIGFQNVGLTRNQIAAGNGVESLGAGNPIYHAVLNLSAPQARDAFDLLSGEIHPSLRTVLFEDSRYGREAVLHRLERAGEPGLALWADGFGDWGQSRSDGNAARLGRAASGFFMGLDTALGGNWRVGVAGGYSHHALDLPARLSNGEADLTQGLIYAGANYGALRLSLGAGYAHVSARTDRSAAFAGFTDRLRARYGGTILQGFGEIGYRVALGGGTVEPFARVAVVDLRTDAFAESGGAAALRGDATNETRTTTTLGLHLATPVAGKLSVDARIGWQHAFGAPVPVDTLRLAGGSGFGIAGVPYSREAGVMEGGFTFQASPGLAFWARYSGMIGDQGHNHAVKGGVSLRF